MEGEDEVPEVEAPETDDSTSTTGQADADTEGGEGGGEASAAAGQPGDAPAQGTDALLGFAEAEWAQELLRQQEEEGKPFEFTAEQIAELPVEAKQLLASLEYRGRLAQAELTKQFEAVEKAKEDAAEAEKRALKAQAEALQWAEAPGLKDFLEKLKPKGNQPDPSSPEGIAWLVNKGVAEQLGAFFEALKGQREASAKASAEAEAKAAREAKMAEIGAYMDKHPEDFEEGSATYKAIDDLYKRAKGTLTVQECHRLVKAKQLEDELEKTNTDQLAAARARVVKGGTRAKVIPQLPKELENDTEAMVEWYEKNPEARARDIQKLINAGA